MFKKIFLLFLVLGLFFISFASFALENNEEKIEGKTIEVIKEYHGPHSGIQNKECLRILSDREWEELWKRHSQNESLPAVDFNKNMVIGVWGGNSINSDGFKVDEIVEGEGVITLIVLNLGYQTVGADADGGAKSVTPYGIFVLPKSSHKIVVMEKQKWLSGGSSLNMIQEFEPLQ